jgi:hypothetical protein
VATAKTYDSVRWHFPDGKDCPSLAAAKVHFDVVMKWLQDNRLLSAEGVEARESGIDADFALTGHMLTDRGNRVLGRSYKEWVRSVSYGSKPSVTLLDKALEAEK